MKPEETKIEWYEGTTITYFDDLVEKTEQAHDVTLERGYLDTFDAIHLSDWKTEVGNWLGGLVEDLESMLEEIEELSDDERGLIGEDE